MTVTLLQATQSQLAMGSLWKLLRTNKKELKWKRRRQAVRWSAFISCLLLLAEQNQSQVFTLIVLLLGNKSSNPEQKVKFNCTENGSPEEPGSDYGVK